MNNFETPQTSLESIVSEPFIPDTADEICQLLEAHGISIDKTPPLWRLSLPRGTIQSEIWPRTLNTRYKITLPDTFVFFLTVERTGRHIIKVPLAAFSEAFQKQHEDNATRKEPSKDFAHSSFSSGKPDATTL